jgi:acyl dehydratase
MMRESMLASYEVEAQNLSGSSENKIHADDVARRFGFSGALVPGVEVYAYACHIPVAVWGREWLARGAIECRFAKPVYDGRLARVNAQADGDSLALRLESDGVHCANATARLAEGAVPPLHRYPLLPLPSERPPADEVSLAPGKMLGAPTREMTDEDAQWYLGGVRESDPLYRNEGIVHPGRILRLCNNALMDNVVLGPWIHVGSKVQHCSIARIGEALSVRARVAANYEKKDHRFVDLDALVLANGERPVAHVLHTAIYRLRPARAVRAASMPIAATSAAAT